MTLLDIIQGHAAGGNPPWVFPAERQTRTLSDLWSASGTIAGSLARSGVQTGDRVVAIAENGSTYVALLLAIWRLGAVAVPLRPYGGKHFWFDRYLAHIDRICDIRAVVYGDAGAFDVSSVAADLGKPFLALADLAAGDSGGAGDGRAPAPVPRAGDDHAVLQFTSGSTGNPKGVIVTHAMLLTQVRQICENFSQASGYPTPRAVASWLPFYHDMGLFIGVLVPLYAGAAALIAPPAFYMRNPALWFGLMSEYRSDLNFTTNAALLSALRALCRRPSTDWELSTLQLCVAAEKVNPQVLRDARNALRPFGLTADRTHVGYGMAEYALGCTYSRPGGARTLHVRIDGGGHVVPLPDAGGDTIELVSVGVPNEGCTITVRDESEEELEELRLGEIHVSGPCVSPGYLNDPENTHARLRDGRLRTGDLGFLHDGELYFVARKDDLMIVAGRNIIPSDVEQALEDYSWIGPGRTVLFGIEDPATSLTRAVLLVEASADLSSEVAQARDAEIRGRVLDQFTILLSDVRFVPKGTIEKTSSGKKRTKVIRQRFLDGTIETIGTDHG